MTEAATDIVITGFTAISAAGVGSDALRQALHDGRSRLQPVPADILGEEGHMWGKADGFRAADFMPPLKARKFDRCSLLAVAATGLALKDAGLELPLTAPERTGLAVGCGFGGIANSLEFLTGYFSGGVEGLAPMLFPNTVPNAAASNASIEHGIKGPNVTLVQRFCSAETAVMMACRFLAEGRADIMLTGGVDELNPYMLKGFKAMGQMRSYGADFGEGAGILVLERRSHAEQRGAKIRGALGDIRTVGLLPPGLEEEGISRLLGPAAGYSLVSLSGSADSYPMLLSRLPEVPRLHIHRLVGRSLAMGGVALNALLLSLPPGARGLHLAASPEGGYFAIDVTGGTPG